jgi:hypothetical protein
MAGKFNSFLKSVAGGFLTPKGYMGDWQHAARTYVDDYFRLAPKAKFLFHCYFSINPGTVRFPQLDQRHRTELGLLVKQVDFPKFNIKTQTLNQYNRKKVIQVTHDYGPMTFRFHDDRANIANMLWQSYYSYYYADSITAKDPSSYARNATSSWSNVSNSYGFDNNSTIPFFDKIILYQMNRKEYVSYTLVNPLISSFSHDQANMSDNGGQGAEVNMTIDFEAVHYDIGAVDSGNVLGFAQDHYDKLPSPLSPLGGGARSLLGQNGVFDGIGAAANEWSKGNYLNAVVAGINTAKNAKSLTKRGIKNEVSNLATNIGLNVAASAITGLKGTTFPGITTTQKTVAQPRSDLNNNTDIGGGG